MQKTILITGSTDGIGLETAKALSAQGHKVLLHGRNQSKLEAAMAAMSGEAESYHADLAQMSDVVAMAKAVTANHDTLDVLINNAGILKTSNTITSDGYDIRFVVNNFAPWLLTQYLLPLLPKDGRVINLSSAAQAPVDLQAMTGKTVLADMAAYSQSKLAITMWSRHVAQELTDGPVIVAVNPGSLLASKMVKEGFGIAGNDISVGVDILVRAALSDEFADASGTYYDNDAKCFASPHSDAMNAEKTAQFVGIMRKILAEYLP